VLLDCICDTPRTCDRLSNVLSDHAELFDAVRSAWPAPCDAGGASPALHGVGAAITYAKTCSALGCPADGVPTLEEACDRSSGKRSPLLAAGYLELGKAHLACGEQARAAEALKRAFAIHPRNAELAILLGLVAIDLCDEKTAERALLVVGLLPSDACDDEDRAVALHHLAAIARARGDVVKAERWTAKARAFDPVRAGAEALRGRVAPGSAHGGVRRVSTSEGPSKRRPA
jgi:hypothetical protein